MPTQCSQEELDFGSCGGRKLVGAFDGGAITSNGGAVLLGATDKTIRLCERVAACFTDFRHAGSIVHATVDLLRQRLFGLALGYEDLIDHDALRFDPALTAVLDKPGGVLAGKSTLNRLEHAGKIGLDRHHKLDHDKSAIERLFVDVFMEAYSEPPVRIVLDLDATDDPLHGEQEGRHFHGYYDCYCYLPLYIFCGRHLLAAKLRTSSVDAADGSVEEVARIVAQIRERWPRTSIVIRADSGFCRDDLMAWCERNNVKYVLGLAGNSRLTAKLAPEMRKARTKAKRTGRPARAFADFEYRTRKSWSTKRRVIGKAEWTKGEANPRFIVTNVHEARALPLRERLLPARRDGEPAEGMPGRPVRRPHTGADDARQPAASVVILVRLRADVRGSSDRARRHGPRTGDVRHHPPAAAEDRRAGHDQRAAREAGVRLGLSKPRGLHAGTATTMPLTG